MEILQNPIQVETTPEDSTVDAALTQLLLPKRKTELIIEADYRGTGTNFSVYKNQNKALINY
jgi:hypothetical protein